MTDAFQFINNLVSTKTPVTVFLMSGIKLQGSITSESPGGIILTRGEVSQLILWHAISTIMPSP